MSSITIIAINMIPLLGVIFLGWRGGMIASLYALETLFIGVLNVLKMLMTQEAADKNKSPVWVQKLIFIPFFIIHYGIFTLAQGSVIIGISLTVEKENLRKPYFLHVFAFSLVCNFAWLFWRDFIKTKTYLKTPLQELMFEPYSRVMLQQAVAIFGLFMLMVLKWYIGMAVLLITLKTILELSKNK